MDVDASSAIDDETDSGSPYHADIRYLAFENINSDDKEMNLHDFDKYEDYWITPSVCESLVDEKPKIEISDKIKMVVDEIDEMKLEKEKKEKIIDDENDNDGEKEKEDEKIDLELNRKKIYLDIGKNIKRFENNKGQINIYEDKNSQEFKIDSYVATCKIAYNTKSTENKKLIEIMENLLTTDKEKYSFVGNKLIRNILTDVYRKVDRIEASKYNAEPITIETTTLFLQPTDDQKDLLRTTRDPVWIRYEKFVRNGDVLEKTESLLYDIFDFEYIETNDELVKIFDLSQCVHEDFEEEFNLVSSLKKEENKDEGTEDEIKIDEAQFRDDLRQELVKAVGGTVLNFPLIEIKKYENEIISRIKFIGKQFLNLIDQSIL